MASFIAVYVKHGSRVAAYDGDGDTDGVGVRESVLLFDGVSTAVPVDVSVSGGVDDAEGVIVCADVIEDAIVCVGVSIGVACGVCDTDAVIDVVDVATLVLVAETVAAAVDENVYPCDFEGVAVCVGGSVSVQYPSTLFHLFIVFVVY